jgi:hypothetical protein
MFPYFPFKSGGITRLWTSPSKIQFGS